MIAAVVLAAGASTRMGSPKQILPYRGRTILGAVVDNLLKSPVDTVVVVLGHRYGDVSGVLEGLPVQIVVNRQYSQGQALSLRAGLSALDGAVEAALFALGDQPGVRPETIAGLVGRYRESGGIVAPFFMGRRGNPVIFDRRFFKEIMSLEGDAGARQIIARHPESLARMDVDDPGVIMDVDTWEDYRSILNKN